MYDYVSQPSLMIMLACACSCAGLLPSVHLSGEPPAFGRFLQPAQMPEAESFRSTQCLMWLICVHDDLFPRAMMDATRPC